MQSVSVHCIYVSMNNDNMLTIRIVNNVKTRMEALYGPAQDFTGEFSG